MANGNSRGRSVSLGCGTLIIIALIVLLFSSTASQRLSEQVEDLQQQVETQTNELREIRRSLQHIEEHLDLQFPIDELPAEKPIPGEAATSPEDAPAE